MTASTGAAADASVGAVLFTDLVGFTEYTETEGDSAALGVLEQQTGLMNEITAEMDARIVKELGDGLMVWFGTPVDAIEGATAMLVAIEAARTDDGFPVAIRMGLHLGEMLRRGDDLVGATVNIASRITDLAGPGELLASEAAVDGCGAHPPTARLDPVGPAPVKGVTEPIWLVRVSAADRIRT